MIYIFTGNGKGKTTAAFGTVLRALNNNKKVFIIQFLKNKDWFKPSEVSFFNKLKLKNLKIESYGKKGWVNFKNPAKIDIDLADKAFKQAEKIITNKKPFLLVLDEINVALLFKLIPENEVLELINSANKNKVHLILTGRGATKKLIAAAEVVTEMKEIKHIYKNGKGEKAIKGLEY